MLYANDKQKILLSGAPDGYTALILSYAARDAGDVLHICRDDVRMEALAAQLAFYAPDVETLVFPAWDTVPYDRVSPKADVIAARTAALFQLADGKKAKKRVVLTTVNAVLQRVPPKDFFASSFSASVGGSFDEKAFFAFLERFGYARTEQVMEAGEYAVRGGIVDVFAPACEEPLRLDLFGDEIESIRTFNPVSQRTTGQLERFSFKPVGELTLDKDSVARFRTKYREKFGAGQQDALYEAVSQGMRFQGMEQWLPLFHERLDTLFDYLPDALVSADYQTAEMIDAREDQIDEYYLSRKEAESAGLAEGGFLYHPVDKDAMFLSRAEFDGILEKRTVYFHYPFVAPERTDGMTVKDASGRIAPDFSAFRAAPDADLYRAVCDAVTERKDKKCVLTAYSAGARDRIAGLLRDKGAALTYADTWADALKVKGTAFVVLGLDGGFETDKLCVLSESDILGERLIKTVRKKRKSDDFIGDVSSLNEGDLVVHMSHGIGRYLGLRTLQVGGAAHDCLCLEYAGGDKLFVPVENIDVLSRYGSETAGVALDKLGGKAWEARKTRLKKHIRDMAEALMKIAAQRYLRPAEKLTAPEGMYDDFCARFPYAETQDQLKSIHDVASDLASGRPMDRLVCGDVGFGKTEVAVRAAFIAAMNGMQVAVVVPTTLLARQHYETFVKRFAGFPVRLAMLSRLTSTKDAALIKKEMAAGTMDIVVGTHALLAKTVNFKKLGLLVIDEEQHFGVAHKERLKELSANIHVLTLTATPIPRTFQMALTGVRELSLIATPPVDRLAVRTFVLPYDSVIVKEAITREKMRGGQVFYVCPRISDMNDVIERLHALLPDVRVCEAHGRMTPTELEKVMTAFADRKYDVLVSTTLIESGLDMPTVNTMIVHRADMFGLAQLYQLRGRVGRGKIRAYAYLTLPAHQKINKVAQKRMEVMQKLDTLGAGFTLASYDLDIRGAGNLLGQEQSGHIKEVGIELYQRMLEEAVAAARAGQKEQEAQDVWTPQINIDMPVLIPETYVRDLNVRMGLYRRLADLTDTREIDAFAAELVDRFGKMPAEVENLLEVIAIKTLCRRANVEKIDAGPKGAVVSLHNNVFPNPAGLVDFIMRNSASARIKPDQRMVFMRVWDNPKIRMKGVRRLLEQIAAAAEVKNEKQNIGK